MIQKFKEVKNSQTMLAKVVNQETDQFGRIVTSYQWIEAKEPISLGSISNPNKEIIGLNFQIEGKDQEKERERSQSFFRNMFGMD
jgi:hypothetical protein